VSTSTFRLRSITLVPVDAVEEQSLKALEKRLPEKFEGISCRIVEVSTNVEEFVKAGSNQYHSTKILQALERHQRNMEVDTVLGVTDLDLYMPSMNFVFGEAQLPGKVAVISTHRLKGSTGYGGEDLFLGRVMKEATHELGHTLGLTHCHSPTCVMFFSNSLKDTDRKSEDYCRSCLAKLRKYA
jgi:archaemetzincin